MPIGLAEGAFTVILGGPKFSERVEIALGLIDQEFTAGKYGSVGGINGSTYAG